MIKLDDSTLRKIQLIQLELLVEADRICRKNNIHYNIIAGTLLGAVRHGGYIPWDDDADIALLRQEYEKFRLACETDLDRNRFYFQDHRNTEGYRWGYGKLRRKDTLFLREYQEHMPYEQGIFIDVFPLDCVPDYYFSRCIKNFECFCVRKLLWSRVGKIADKNGWKRQIYKILDKIPERMIFRYYDKMILHANKKQTGLVRILMFPTPNKTYGYDKRWYEESMEIKFENTLLKGIKDYDSYLSFKFGDYMELPPKEERRTHPISTFEVLDDT